ncbi:MAG: lipopolysaccharide transport periplasmic protein LptA [Halothiobacillaceae bacterium]
MPLKPLILLLLPALFVPAVSWGASADRQEPIEIQADRKTTDYRTGVGRYEGGVIITQGTLRATADVATIYVEEDRFDRAVLTGAPATFREIDDEGREIRASAREAVYEAAAERVTLEGDAVVERDGDRLSSARIEYDMAKQVVRAEGGDERDRVRLILMPREQEEDQP